MKKQYDAKPLKGVIDDMLRIFGLEDKMKEAEAAEVWAKVVGTYAANRTLAVHLTDGVMRVRLDSAVLKEEFSMGKSKLIALMNEEAGKNLIKDIEFR